MQGRTCTKSNEIVLTEFVAADLGVSVGDSVMLVASRGREKYIISGIFGSNVLPVSAVVGCFVLFSWLAAGKLKKIDLAIWINMEK